MCKKINAFTAILIVLYIIASIVMSLVFSILKVTLPLWAECIISALILIIPVCIYLAVLHINPFELCPYKKISFHDTVMMLIGGYLLVPLVLFINSISMLFAHNYLNDTLTELQTYPVLIQLLIIAVIPAITEEFIYRGVIYHSYRKNGMLPAVFLTGLIFGIFHLNINQFMYAFILGMIFCFLIEISGSMFASMLAHFAINSYSIILSWIILNVSDTQIQTASQAAAQDELMQISGAQTLITLVQILLIGIIAIVCTIVAFFIFKRIAVRNNRWESLKNDLKTGFKKCNGEKFITWPLIFTVIIGFAIMIFIEMK